MDTLLHVIDDMGDIIECYALGYSGDAKTRIVALQIKLDSDDRYASLAQTGLKAVVAKAYADTMSGDKAVAISALARLSRLLWQDYWGRNEARPG